MCGICGQVTLDTDRRVDPELIGRMTRTLAHRGPDDIQQYVEGAVGLGHVRLSIIDLEGGRQPVANEDGTIRVVFNGEIYNYQALRKELAARGHRFRQSSDTEVLVHLYEEYGERMLPKLRGMFAFAIWDSRHHRLFLARDRVGIKPLYYYMDGQSLLFASEVKAILADPHVPRSPNMGAMSTFLSCYYTTGSDTLFSGISKLSPGHSLSLQNGSLVKKQYWDLTFSQPSQRMSAAHWCRRLSDVLSESVREHMISDVPVGVLLSGGVDSSAILGYATEHARHPIKTFTVGFNEGSVADERPAARKAAELYNSEHHEVSFDAQAFAEALPAYVRHMEEPVCEPPAIALFYLSEMVRRHVKVVLSGEGGDEAFAGYGTYRNALWFERTRHLLDILAPPLRTMIGSSRGVWRDKARRYLDLLDYPLPAYYRSRAATPLTFFSRDAKASCTDALARLLESDETSRHFAHHFEKIKSHAALNQMLYVDTKTWLPDDLLIKADKMTMAHSIELRVPLLDHEVLEFAAGIPSHYKVRGHTTKYILKKTLRSRVPRELLRLKKRGFVIPYSNWLRHDLAEMVADTLSDARTRQRGYFNPAAIDALLAEHRKTGACPKEVFSLLVLELWHREFMDGPNADGTP